MGQLDGKVVIVTGATRGIGLGIAVVAHREGAYVLAAGRDSDALSGLADEMSDADHFVTTTVDVTDEQQVKDMIASAVERWGRVDGIVNNAGILIPGTILDASLADLETTLKVNVHGVFLGTKYAVEQMLKQGSGSIVNVGSINSLAAEKYLTTYCASKGAVHTLTQAVALDFAAQGIRANTLCPGFVDTDLNVPHYTALGGRSALEAGLADFQPIGRAILPEEMANAVVFLLSDNSSAITGTAFVVDGGVLCKA